ncbi:MAG TPA: recombinase family protein [Candidatus Gemmiger faecigallinarum]|nr:recombinase family protein [Candidatus Gemmiger faecigallinarum]
MKRLSLPFGYSMQSGQIVVLDTERTIVERIYSEYLSGASAGQIATALNDAGIAYKDVRGWNKNIVYRILDDIRYRGENGFPALICLEKWLAVAARRKEKATPYMEPAFQVVRKKLVCANCEGKLTRHLRKNKTAWWECRLCGRQTGVMDDADICHLIQKKLTWLYRNPHHIRNDGSAAQVSLESVRLERELTRLLADPTAEASKLDALAKQITQLRYLAIDPQNHAYKTEQILKTLNGTASQKDAADLLQKIVSRILLDKNGSVQVKLINGQIV